MAYLQNHFELFHNKIKVDNEPLIEKRDIILDRIRSYLRDKGLPGFELVNQGSYIYGVGVRPIGDEEFDIDVGLAFNIATKDYPDAKVVRNWVFDAIDGHTDKVVQKGPCIRVHYAQGFHVDLVVYAKHTDNKEIENFRLGFKDGSWKPSQPKELKQYIRDKREPFKNSKTDETGADQLQRMVRYLKRWNDKSIPGESDDKPFGLAILLLAINSLPHPHYDIYNKADDLLALRELCRKAVPAFGRIIAKKPTQEFEDTFGKISEDGMKKLIARLNDLKSVLDRAYSESNVEAAAKLLVYVFGDDFPVSEEIKKSEITSSLMLDETSDLRKAKSEAIKRIVANVSSPSSPWST